MQLISRTVLLGTLSNFEDRLIHCLAVNWGHFEHLLDWNQHILQHSTTNFGFNAVVLGRASFESLCINCVNVIQHLCLCHLRTRRPLKVLKSCFCNRFPFRLNPFIEIHRVVVDLGFTTLLTCQVISIAFYSERDKSDKYSSEALISASGSFMCRESTTRDLRLYFPCEESHTLLRSEKIHRPRPGFNPPTSDPVESMITTGPPESTT